MAKHGMNFKYRVAVTLFRAGGVLTVSHPVGFTLRISTPRPNRHVDRLDRCSHDRVRRAR